MACLRRSATSPSGRWPGRERRPSRSSRQPTGSTSPTTAAVELGPLEHELVARPRRRARRRARSRARPRRRASARRPATRSWMPAVIGSSSGRSVSSTSGAATVGGLQRACAGAVHGDRPRALGQAPRRRRARTRRRRPGRSVRCHSSSRVSASVRMRVTAMAMPATGRATSSATSAVRPGRRRTSRRASRSGQATAAHHGDPRGRRRPGTTAARTLASSTMRPSRMNTTRSAQAA